MQTNIGNLDVIERQGCLELRLHNQVRGVRSAIVSRNEAARLFEAIRQWLNSDGPQSADDDLIG